MVIWQLDNRGIMTLYSLLHAPDLLRAGMAGAPVTDWRNYDTIYTERYLGLPSGNNAVRGPYRRHMLEAMTAFLERELKRRDVLLGSAKER